MEDDTPFTLVLYVMGCGSGGTVGAPRILEISGIQGRIR